MNNTNMPFPEPSECIWTDADFNVAIAVEKQSTIDILTLNDALRSLVPHEIAHLYQGDLGVPGGTWWGEGQAEYFSGNTGVVGRPEPRLRYLATLDDTIPTLAGENISRELRQADGCMALNYDVGFSFVNWFVNTFGLDTHAEVVHLQSEETIPIAEAIETVTGEDFFDIENQWRAYIGFAPLTLADVDPAAALEAAVDPVYQEGDTFTLPATPIQFPLNEAPGALAAPNVACFANTEVTVLRVGQLDGVNYYELDCLGIIGWVAEDALP